MGHFVCVSACDCLKFSPEKILLKTGSCCEDAWMFGHNSFITVASVPGWLACLRVATYISILAAVGFAGVEGLAACLVSTTLRCFAIRLHSCRGRIGLQNLFIAYCTDIKVKVEAPMLMFLGLCSARSYAAQAYFNPPTPLPQPTGFLRSR